MQPGVHHRLLGSLLLSNTGKLMWTGWLVDPEQLSLPLPKLCQTVSSFFHKEGEGQNSSYLDAGNFAAASTSDGDYIVTIICTPNAPETEVLLKARELSHSLKLLLGPCSTTGASSTESAQVSDDLLKLLQASVVSSSAGTVSSVPQHAVTWLEQHASNGEVSDFMLAKLQTLSPCTAAFHMLEQAPGFICAHFIDVTEPGEVLLSHWVKPNQPLNRTSSGGFKLGKQLRSIGKGMLGSFKSHGTTKPARSNPAAIASIQQLMSRPISSLWTLVMREARSLALVASQSRRTVTLGLAGSDGGNGHSCTIDLTALVPDAGASLALVQMQHYEAAFVIVYTVPGGPLAARRQANKSKGKHALAFEVVHGGDAMPAAVRPYMQAACADVKARFPVTRMQLLQQIWPDIPSNTSAGGQSDIQHGHSDADAVDAAGVDFPLRSSQRSHVSGQLDAQAQHSLNAGVRSNSMSRSQHSMSAGEQSSNQDAINTAVAAAYSGPLSGTHQSSSSPIKPPIPRASPKHPTSLGMCFMGILEPSAQGSRACSIQPEPVADDALTRSGHRRSTHSSGVPTDHGGASDHAAGGMHRMAGQSSGGRTAWAAAVQAAQQQDNDPPVPAPLRQTTDDDAESSWGPAVPQASTTGGMPTQHVLQMNGTHTAHPPAVSSDQSRQQHHIRHPQAQAGTLQAQPHPDWCSSDSSLVDSYKQGVYQAKSRAAPGPTTQAPLQASPQAAATMDADKENTLQQQPGEAPPQKRSPAAHTTRNAPGAVLAPLSGLMNLGHAAAAAGGQGATTDGSHRHGHPNGGGYYFTDHDGNMCCPRPPSAPSRRPASPNASRRHTHSTFPTWDKPATTAQAWQTQGLIDAYHSRHQLTAAVLQQHGDQDVAQKQYLKQHPARQWQGHAKDCGSPGDNRCQDQARQRDQTRQQRQRRRHGWDGPPPPSARRRLRELGSDTSSVRVPTATELLQGSLTREEERRWRLQLMYENLSLRSALCPTSSSGAPCFPAAYPHPPYSPNSLDAPPASMPPGYLGPPYSTGLYYAAAPPPASSTPPGYMPVYIPASPTPQVHHTTLEVCGPTAQPTAHSTSVLRDAVYVSACQQPTSSPQVLLAPQGHPSAQPYCIWQLFNGQWYQLISSGQWVPSAPPPTNQAGDGCGRGTAHGAASPTGSAPLAHADTKQRSSPAVTPAGMPLNGAQQGPLPQHIAQDIAGQLWKQLQGLALTRQQLDGGDQHPAMSEQTLPSHAGSSAAAVVPSPGRRKVAAAAAALPVSGTQVDSLSRDMQYYVGPEGQMYCCSDGKWFQVSESQSVV